MIFLNSRLKLLMATYTLKSAHTHMQECMRIKMNISLLALIQIIPCATSLCVYVYIFLLIRSFSIFCSIANSTYVYEKCTGCRKVYEKEFE